MKWINDDYVPTLHRIGVDEKSVPNFFEALSDAQLQYIQRVKAKMVEWVPNIAVEDAKQTPVKINRLAYTTAPVDLFGIVKEQIEMAKQSKYSDFIFQVVNALVIPLEEYPRHVKAKTEEKLQKLYEQLNDKKKKKSSEDEDDDEQQQNEEDDDEFMIDVQYMCALINNSNKCIENTNEMVENVLTIIPADTYAKRFDFSTVEKQFDTLIETCCKAILEKILADCDEVIKQLFEDEYYDEGDMVEMIAQCMDDYFTNDIKECLLDVYYKQITERTLREFVNRYLTQLITKKHKFNKKDRTNTGTMIKKDYKILVELMGTHITDQSKLGSILTVINGFGDLIESPADSVKTGAVAILRDFKDCPIELLKYIIDQRDDLGHSDKGVAEEELEKTYDSIVLNLKNFKPTILSQIQPPSKLGAFGKK